MSAKPKQPKLNPLAQPKKGPLTDKVAKDSGAGEVPRNHSFGNDTSVDQAIFALTQMCAATEPKDFREAVKVVEIIFANLPEAAVTPTKRCNPVDQALDQMYCGCTVLEIITTALSRTDKPYSDRQIDSLVHTAECSLIVHFGLSRFASKAAAYQAFDNVVRAMVTYGTILRETLCRQFNTLIRNQKKVYARVAGINNEIIRIARESTEGPSRDVETVILEMPLRMKAMGHYIDQIRREFIAEFGPGCVDAAESDEDKVKAYKDQLTEHFKASTKAAKDAKEAGQEPVPAAPSGGEPVPVQAAAPEPVGAPGPDSPPEKKDDDDGEWGGVYPEDTDKIDWTAGQDAGVEKH